MATETRSHHGCWSCRLRKKKCDERRPICTECMCVGLECHGFGEKPEWMDRGARQKAQAAKMKEKVAQVTKSRRMNQIRDQHGSSLKRQQSQNNISVSSGGPETGTSNSSSSSSSSKTGKKPRNNSISTNTSSNNNNSNNSSSSSNKNNNTTNSTSTGGTIHVQVPNHNNNNHHHHHHHHTMDVAQVNHVFSGDTFDIGQDIGHFSPPPSYSLDPLTGSTLAEFHSMSGFDDLDFFSAAQQFEVDLPDLETDNSTVTTSSTSAEELAAQLAHHHYQHHPQQQQQQYQAGIALRDLNLVPENAFQMAFTNNNNTTTTTTTTTPTTTTTQRQHMPSSNPMTPTPTPTQTPPDLDYAAASWGSPTNMSMLPITSIQEAILFANYLDKVFHWQFRFCSLGGTIGSSISSSSGSSTSTSSRGRRGSDGPDFHQGHYIWLMSRSRPLYLASLALSSSYMSSSRPLLRTPTIPWGGAKKSEGFPPTYAEVTMPGNEQEEQQQQQQQQQAGYTATAAGGGSGGGDERGGGGGGGGGGGMERYEIATQELQRYLKTSSMQQQQQQQNNRPTDHVAMLACIVSFISFSFLHPAQIDWHAHLKVGTALIAPWVHQQQQSPPQKQQPEPNTPEESARLFFTASVILLDILTSLTSFSSPPSPSLSESYRFLLATPTPTTDPDNGGAARAGGDTKREGIINLVNVSGAQNWVFILLLDVYALRDWKRSTRAAGLLSLWELTSKANAIKTELETGISRNLEVINQLLDQGESDRKQDMSKGGGHVDVDMDRTQEPEPREEDDGSTTPKEVLLITHALASAVSVLLEVIVSGAYPQLPEIKAKVARALEAFTAVAQLPDGAELVEAGLGWPLFVVGCVVEEEFYPLLRNLAGAPSTSIMEDSNKKKRSRAQSMGVMMTPVSPRGHTPRMGSMHLDNVGALGNNNRRLSGVLDMLEAVWRARSTGEMHDDGFDYSMVAGFRSGEKGCDVLIV